MEMYRVLISKQMDLELHLMGAKIVGRTDLIPTLTEQVVDAQRVTSNYLWTHPEVAIEAASIREAGQRYWSAPQ